MPDAEGACECHIGHSHPLGANPHAHGPALQGFEEDLASPALPSGVVPISDLARDGFARN